MPPKKVLSKKTETATKPAPAVKKSISQAAQKSKYYLVIDCPVQGETITSSHYTMRIGAPLSLCHENNWVEVAIDNGNWNPCRLAAGYFWFDWSNYPAMEHKIVARIRDQQGNTVQKSEVRKCKSTF